MIFKYIFLATLCANHQAVLSNPVYATAIQVQKSPDPLPILAPYSSSVLPYPGNFARFSAPAAPIISRSQLAKLGPIPPCAPPCIVEPIGEYVAQVVPVPSSVNYPTASNIITAYGPPKVIEEPKNTDNTYEYSYLVVDENTGDQKAQHEQSDGKVVRGQYSLIQPDGYIREVQYTADDISGFNAIVKNFLPKSLENVPAEKANLEEKRPESYGFDDQKQKKAPNGEKKEPTELKESTKEISKDKSPEANKIILSFDDIIRCANLLYGSNSDESADIDTITEKTIEKTSPSKENKSALTYIILPSLGMNKPC